MANTVFGVLIERIEEQKTSAMQFLVEGSVWFASGSANLTNSSRRPLA